MTDKPSKSHGRLANRPTLKPRELVQHTPDLAHVWAARVITLFPEAFPGVLGQSLTGKALKDGLWQLHTLDLRRYGVGKHRDVDDTPSGGGAGMVMRADVLGRALDDGLNGVPASPNEWPVIYLSPRGRPLTQEMARGFAKAKGMTLLCGRFEGIDERVIDEYQIQEVSLGDFILTGGEIAAQALIDATVRLLPGVLGNEASAEEESFSNGLLEHPHYTGPRNWRDRAIPEVLLSGHHGKIAQWREDQSKEITKTRRPDLWEAFEANSKDKP